ncbi:hypothetical protein HMI54_006973, partial [Coelomomyces lativittatus]
MMYLLILFINSIRFTRPESQECINPGLNGHFNIFYFRAPLKIKYFPSFSATASKEETLRNICTAFIFNYRDILDFHNTDSIYTRYITSINNRQTSGSSSDNWAHPDEFETRSRSNNEGNPTKFKSRSGSENEGNQIGFEPGSRSNNEGNPTKFEPRSASNNEDNQHGFEPGSGSNNGKGLVEVIGGNDLLEKKHQSEKKRKNRSSHGESFNALDGKSESENKQDLVEVGKKKRGKKNKPQAESNVENGSGSQKGPDGRKLKAGKENEIDNAELKVANVQRNGKDCLAVNPSHPSKKRVHFSSVNMCVLTPIPCASFTAEKNYSTLKTSGKEETNIIEKRPSEDTIKE